MNDQRSGRVFISYSTKDGAAFAGEVRAYLLRHGLSVWQDLLALKGGQDWWSQIEEVIRSKELEHFVLILTPGALASPIVRREIRLARQEGKTVCPIAGPGLENLADVPRWIGHLYRREFEEQRRLFIRVLEGPSQQKRVAMMAPEPPEDFVPRPAEFGALKQQLLDGKGDAVAITAALRGAGGYGKTTMAKALAHDIDIQDAYFDGILWAELGEKPESLLRTISDLVTRLTGTPPGLGTIPAAAAALAEALGDRRILLVIDDAWREQDLKPFLQGGPRTTRLITTRNDNILPTKTIRQPVDAMQAAEAVDLLAAGLPKEQVPARRLALQALAARLGEWPLLLKLVNGFLRRAVGNKKSLAEAIAGVGQRLDERGLDAFSARDEADRTKAVARTIGVSLDLLTRETRARFGELGVFPEDADIPVALVARLWQVTGGLSESEAEDVLLELAGLSLLLTLDLDRRMLRLHDTIRRFLRNQASKENLVAQQRRLLGPLQALRYEAVGRYYYYFHLPYHLAEANDRPALDKLLLDPGWLMEKLAACNSTSALVADYSYAEGEAQHYIGRALRLVSSICARDPRQLLPQMLGRLMTQTSVVETGFLNVARKSLLRPTIVAQRPSRPPPGAEIARLEGHSSAVSALYELTDGCLASGSYDKTIRLWDVARGNEIARLKGHSEPVSALCMLSDGRLASGADDDTIRLWDVAKGNEVGPSRRA